MFDHLYQCPFALARHRNGPMLEERVFAFLGKSCESGLRSQDLTDVPPRVTCL